MYSGHKIQVSVTALQADLFANLILVNTKVSFWRRAMSSDGTTFASKGEQNRGCVPKDIFSIFSH